MLATAAVTGQKIAFSVFLMETPSDPKSLPARHSYMHVIGTVTPVRIELARLRFPDSMEAAWQLQTHAILQQVRTREGCEAPAEATSSLDLPRLPLSTC